jgi:hypothetical protein
MTKDSAIKRNLDLLNEFMRYSFENPEVLEKIPPEAELVSVPIRTAKILAYINGRRFFFVAAGFIPAQKACPVCQGGRASKIGINDERNGLIRRLGAFATF